MRNSYNLYKLIVISIISHLEQLNTMQKQLLYFANHFTLYCTPSNSIDMKRNTHTQTKTSSSAVAERPRDASCQWIFRWVTQGHSRSLKMVPFERLGTVCYWHSIATTPVSLAVSTQCTNVTVTQTDRQPDTVRRPRPRLHTTSRCKQGLLSLYILGSACVQWKIEYFLKFI